MGLSLCWLISSVSRMRHFGLHSVPQLSWSSDLGAYDSLNSHCPQVPPALGGAFSQATVTWCYHMGRWDGWSGKRSTSSEAQEWPSRAIRSARRNLPRGWSGVPDRDTYVAWSCSGARGWKEVNHLGVTLDPSNVLPCCIPQWSNGMPWWLLSSYLQPIWRTLAPPLLSLKQGVCDQWYAWLGSLVVLGRLKDPCPDAMVTREFKSFLVFGFFF